MFGIDIVSWRTLSCAVPFNDLCSMRWTSRESIWFFKDWKTLYNADATGHKHVPSGYHVSNWMWHHKLNRFDIFNLQLFVTDLLCPVIIWWHFDGPSAFEPPGESKCWQQCLKYISWHHGLWPQCATHAHVCITYEMKGTLPHYMWKSRSLTVVPMVLLLEALRKRPVWFRGGPQHGAQPCHHKLSSLGPFYTASRRRARGMEAGRWGGLKTF